MDETTKGINALKKEIRAEIRAILKLNMTFEGWSIPEMDDKEATTLILEEMQKALDELQKEYKFGGFSFSIKKEQNFQNIDKNEMFIN